MGEFWLPSTNGLLRYPKINFLDLNRIAPKTYTVADGLFSNSVTSLFEDSRGDIWISSLTNEKLTYPMGKNPRKIYRYIFDDGLPKASGTYFIWRGCYGKHLDWVLWSDSSLQEWKVRNFTDEGLIQSTSYPILPDKQGRLWLATSSRGTFLFR